MNIKTKYIIGTGGIILLTIVGFLIFGLYLMNEEDRYGNLVYFHQKVEDGDIIFRGEKTTDINSKIEFNEYGIVDISLGKVYVWDNKNTLKRNLYEWTGGKRVKVFRIKAANFDIKNAEKKNGNYNYLMNSDKMEFITENY